MTLTWEAPADDGGGAVTAYEITYKASSDADWTSWGRTGAATDTTETVTGLTNEVVYEFRVAAVNAVGAGAPSAPVSATPEARVPLHRWAFDDGSGTTAADAGTADVDGTVAGGAAWEASGRLGGALSFDGVDDHVQIGASSLAAAVGWTAALWVRRDGDAVADAVLFAPDALGVAKAAFKLETTAANKVGFSDDSTSRIFNYTAPLGSWVHLTFVGDSSGVTLYADGASVETINDSFDLPLHRIGALADGTDLLHGALDDVRVYNTALAANAVKALYDAYPQAPGAPRGLTAAAGNGQVTLTWQAPASDGGGAITAYVIEYKASSDADWTSWVRTGAATDTTETVTGLTNEVAYEFRVAAVNAAGAGAPSAVSATPTPLPAPTHHWAFDDGSGTTAADAGTADVDGTVAGGAAWEASGRVGGALSFDGSNDYVQIGASSLAAADGWTAALWVRRASDRSSTALFGLPAAGGQAVIKLEQYRNTHQVGVTIFGTGDYTFNYTTTIGSWVHLTFVGDNNGVTLYADGASVGTLNHSIALPLHRIGALATGALSLSGLDYMHGALDDVRVYNTAFPAAQVKQLYDTYSQAAGAPQAATPTHHWAFDDGSGTTAADAGTADVDGTVAGGAAWEASGRLGGALSFDGVDDHMDVGAASLAAAVGWTAALWVRRDGDGAADAVLFAPDALGAAKAAFKLETTAANKVGFSDDSTSRIFNYVAPLGSWVHLTFVGDSSGVTLYADGASVETLNHVFDLPLHRIGALATGADRLHGALDDVRVYNTALAAIAVEALYTAYPQAPGAPSALTAAAGNGQVTLTWQAPADDGGDAVTAYVIAYKASSDADWTSWVRTGAATDTTETVTGLTNEVTYEFRVAAVNAAGAGAPSAPVSATPALLPAPIHHWAFDDGSGTTADDAGTADVDGTVAGGAAWEASGRVGGALSFDGSNDYVQIGASSLAAADGWTAALWVRRASDRSSTALFGLPAARGQAVIKLEQHDKTHQVGVTIFGTGDYTFNYTAPIGSWVHLTFVGDNNGVTLYAGGASVGTLNQSIALPLHRIGALATGTLALSGLDYMHGALDDVRVYNTAFLAVQVKQLYDTYSQAAGAPARSRRAAPPAHDIYPEAPGAPSGLVAAAGNGQVTLTWEAPVDDGGGAVAAYVIAYKVSSDTDWTSWVRTGAATDTTETVTGLTNNVVYEFRVAAVNAAGVGAPSAVSATPVPLPAPASLPAPTHHWTFDDGAGITVADAGTANTDGTVAGGATWEASGRVGGALSFDGVDDHVQLGAASLAASVGWTAALWVRRDGDTSSAALFAPPGGGQGAIKLEQYGSSTHQVGVTLFGIGDYTFNYTTPIGSWAHLVFVGDNNGVTLYVDGARSGTLNESVDLALHRIGANIGGGSHIHATLDDVRVYNEAFTAAQVKQLQ